MHCVDSPLCIGIPRKKRIIILILMDCSIFLKIKNLVAKRLLLYVLNQIQLVNVNTTYVTQYKYLCCGPTL